jgi:hypothetical protein
MTMTTAATNASSGGEARVRLLAPRRVIVAVQRLLSSLERRLEWLAERPFVGLRATHPLHVERALLRAMDAGIRVSGRGTYAPSEFDVRMNPVTLDSVSGPRLLADVEAVLTMHQEERGFVREPVSVRLFPDPDVAIGVIDVRPAVCGDLSPEPVAASMEPRRAVRSADRVRSRRSTIGFPLAPVTRAIPRMMRRIAVASALAMAVLTLGVVLPPYLAGLPMAVRPSDLAIRSVEPQAEPSPVGPQAREGEGEVLATTDPDVAAASPGRPGEQTADESASQSQTVGPGSATGAAEADAIAAAQSQGCRVMAQQPLASAGSYLTGDGWNRVQYWWRGQPEREVALPPVVDGGYRLLRPMSGWLWVWSPSCTEEQMHADMIASVARRTAAGAVTAGWVEWREAGWETGPIAEREGDARDGSTR